MPATSVWLQNQHCPPVTLKVTFLLDCLCSAAGWSERHFAVKALGCEGLENRP